MAPREDNKIFEFACLGANYMSFNQISSGNSAPGSTSLWFLLQRLSARITWLAGRTLSHRLELLLEQSQTTIKDEIYEMKIISIYYFKSDVELTRVWPSLRTGHGTIGTWWHGREYRRPIIHHAPGGREWHSMSSGRYRFGRFCRRGSGRVTWRWTRRSEPGSACLRS